MKRAILLPADVTGVALAELKQWLGISSSNEDAQLTGLLHAGLDMCEGFTGQMPIEVTCEEFHPLTHDWVNLDARPVGAITSVELVAADGTRNALPAADYEIDIEADGTGRVRLISRQSGRYVAISFVAGIAADWTSLPDALRHGVVRLAAHIIRDRDAADPLGPPTSVAALWRPWRRLRVA